jgi:hypothetical protein
MAEVVVGSSGGGGGGGNSTIINTAANPVVIRPLDCTTDHVDLCDRAARLVGIVFGNLTQLQQRAITNELLVQMTNAGVEIDPRDIRVLTFLTDKVDVSGSSVNAAVTGSVTATQATGTNLHTVVDSGNVNASVTGSVSISGTPNVTTVSGSLTSLEDTFMSLRLLVNSLGDLAIAIDPSNGRMRTTDIIESGSLSTIDTVTNLSQIGGNNATGFIFDEMDIVFNTGIRPQIV